MRARGLPGKYGEPEFLKKTKEAYPASTGEAGSPRPQKGHGRRPTYPAKHERGARPCEDTSPKASD